MASRLLVIDPSILHAEDAGVREVLEGWTGEARLLRPALAPGDGPRPGDPFACDGVVVMGSAASVHDDRPWLRDLAAWLAPLVGDGPPLPVLGICFGHQLVAQLAGGHVTFVRPDREPLRGVVTTTFSGGRLVPVGVLDVVASHREHVAAAPPGWTVTAARPEVPVDALEHPGRPGVTGPFHPEAREEFLARRGIAAGPDDAPWRGHGRAVLRAFKRLVASR